ncbi:MAG: ComEA family DNA-binding protein, partial [Caldilineae bacterium]
RRPPAQAIEILPPPTPDAGPVATPTPSPLRVYVSGAVRTPGVYRLSPDSLVEDAIAKAGGPTDEADLVAINLAHPLSDGEQIYVPSRADNVSPPPVFSSRASGSTTATQDDAAVPGPVDLNTATAEELEALPGIGPKTAEAIIEGRPYSAVDDLLRVKGIGEKTLEKLRPYVTVR